MLNSVTIMGRLCAAPELKHTANGTAVTSFSLATERDYSGSEEKKTDFFTVIAWRNTAEFIVKYFSRGQQIAVKGHLTTEQYEKDGQKRTAVNIVAESVYFCGSKISSEKSAGAGDDELTTIDVSDEDLPF